MRLCEKLGGAVPVSKSRPKKKVQASPAKFVLPDAQAMDTFLFVLGDKEAADALNRAQDVMYDAWEQTKPSLATSLAHGALALSPICADAFVLLAQKAAKSAREAKDLYELGVQAGERALGPAGFKEFAPHFWGFLETRPYMRARAGLAGTLFELNDIAGAAGHFRALLELNPGDNQGLRYSLLACLFKEGDQAGVDALLDRYGDEESTHWLYGRVLAAYRVGKADAVGTKTLVRRALTENTHVPALLAGTKRPVSTSHGFMTLGQADEAAFYCGQFASAWRDTQGAVAWLVTMEEACMAAGRSGGRRRGKVLH